MKLKALFLLGLLSFGSQAETFNVSAISNCIYPPLSNTQVQKGTPILFNLSQGTYTFTLSSNTMYCQGGTGCPIDRVFLQGGMGNARWGATVSSSPTTITVPPTTAAFMAFVSDDSCSNNAGSATIQATKIN
ncbi:hypothetical protein [Pantoea sp. At-9b]|uniref:hypothetical protein n=1 Tax=Pantoea sp. (strain At-9b) TaxID=592316 RepID=UPI0001B3E1F9|nr:hypothetical protein [Pantoea sp. At-9b]ADU71519.1 conserved hypothetical protein [Pantoea sp. At-9b]